MVSVVPYFAKTPLPNPRLSARSVWSLHAATQKLTITRQDTYAFASALNSPSRLEVPPPPAHWLKNLPISDQKRGSLSESCYLSCGGDDERRRRYEGSTYSDNSDNMSEISDSSESAFDGAGVTGNTGNTKWCTME
jgi:hypothetical protein